MTAAIIQELNTRYAIPGHVIFTDSAGGLVTAEVDNSCCQGAITLAGGHIISYQPVGQEDVLWMSPLSPYAVGQSLRGGIPICWPWFGPHPEQPDSKPKHGFARDRLWSLLSTCALSNGSTEISLQLRDDAETFDTWPSPFELTYTAVFGTTLQVMLMIRNPGEKPFSYTGALHHYFRVGDVRNISVTGLDDKDYLDKVDKYARKHQSGDIRITGQTDRIYLDTWDDCIILDPVLSRRIRVSKKGSRTTVVWNPAERAALIPDVGIGNDAHFVCVETANAADDQIMVFPGETKTLSAELAVEQWT